MDMTEAATIFGNTFGGNHALCLDGNPGGQIFINYEAANIQITGNSFNGESVTCPPSANSLPLVGLELYGPNASIWENTITNQSYDGIAIGGPFVQSPVPSATITDNTISNNYANGIEIVIPWYTACMGSTLFSITGNTFSNNATSTVNTFFQIDYGMPTVCGWSTSSDPPFLGPIPLSAINSFSGAGGRIYGDYYGGPTFQVPTLYPIQ